MNTVPSTYSWRSSQPGLPRHGHVVEVVVLLHWILGLWRRFLRGRRPLHRRGRPGLRLRELQVLLRREALPVEQLVLRHAHVAGAAVVALVGPIVVLFEGEPGGGRSGEGSVAVGKEIVAELVGRLRVGNDGQLLQVPLQKWSAMK